MGAWTLLVLELSAKSKIEPEESEDIVVDSCFSSSVTDYVDKYLVRLEKKAPSLVSLNEDFSYNYVVTAKDKIKRVVVEEQIPSGATFVDSAPLAQVDGNKVTWILYNLEKDESVPLELVVNATTIADFASCATVVAYPEACTNTSVGVPIISVMKTTPLESVDAGSSMPWSLTVTNSGAVCAKDVVVTDSFPEGLVNESGENEQIIELGTLGAGESRQIETIVTAVEPGEYCSDATAVGSNVELVADEFCFIVIAKGVGVTQEGPQNQFVGKTATYTTRVVNIGSVAFDEVIIYNIAPDGSKLLAAPDAEIDKNIATWTTDLAAGEEKSFKVDLLVTKDGTYCNEANVLVVDSDIGGSDSVCTEWSGYPALLIEVIDNQDPVVVGEEITYIIQIANQGTAADTNVVLDLQIPKGLTVISAAGETQGVVTENDISFAPYPVLNPKEMIQYRVTTKLAYGTGELRLKAQMSSDMLKIPVPEEEITIIH